MGKDPSMPFYVNDWLSSSKVTCMTLEQQGAFIRLLAHCWASQDASIPDDDEELSSLSGMGEGWLNGGSRLVRRCFVPHPDKEGYLTNKKLLSLWNERQLWRRKSSEGGLKSAAKRRLQSSKGGSTTVPTKRQPKGNSSSSSSSSLLNTPLPPFPTILDTPEFRTAIESWLAYKPKAYKPKGLQALLTRARKRAEVHGVAAVVDAFEQAMGNTAAGWDYDSYFPRNSPPAGKTTRPRLPTADEDARWNPITGCD